MCRLRRHKVLFVAALSSVILYLCVHKRHGPNTNLHDTEEREIKAVEAAEKPRGSNVVQKARDKLQVGNVFYNRVGKCGSRSFMQVVYELAKRNNFRVRASDETDRERPGSFENLQEMMSISNFVPPTFYNRHIHYLDFRRYHLRQPIYINLIRDPIDRFASQYNYLKYGDGTSEIKDGSKIDLVDINACVMKDVGICNSSMMFYTGMYFCGLMDPVCTERNNPERVRLAIKHIDEEYLFVGLLEEFEITLQLFEILLPDYFAGASKLWREISESSKNATATKRRDVLSEESKEKLRTHTLADEYKVYYHVKETFDTLKEEMLNL